MNVTDTNKKVFLCLLITLLSFFGTGFYLILFDTRYHFLLKFGISALSLFTFSAATYFSLNYRVTKVIHCFVLITISLYSFIGVCYGPPNSSFLTSFLETNKQEAIEFFMNINYWVFLLPTALILSTVSFVKLPILKPPSQKLNKIKKFSRLFIYVVLVYSCFPYPTYSFFINIKSTIKEYYLYKNNFKKKDSETLLVVAPQNGYKKYTFYVVIIGESVRKDYMSAYGYPIETTPFLNNVNGTFFTNYISAAPNTVPSLQFSLTLNNATTSRPLSENVVTIAKSAKFKTYWLSNQGAFGEYDSFISQIAQYTDEFKFLKLGDYDSANIDDFRLLKSLNDLLSQMDKNESHIIFIHMMGSHPYTCERLNGFPRKFHVSSHQATNCYLDTISKLDAFINKTKTIMDATSENYSILYFSDHGMDVSESGVKVNNIYKQNYAIPLFIINSDDQERHDINQQISAMNFPSIFANWIGVKSDSLLDINAYQELGQSNIEVFNWNKFISFDSLENQAPLE